MKQFYVRVQTNPGRFDPPSTAIAAASSKDALREYLAANPATEATTYMVSTASGPAYLYRIITQVAYTIVSL